MDPAGLLRPDRRRTLLHRLRGGRGRRPVQEVVSTLGFARLLGAGNSIQMSNAKHMIRVPWNKISFNYDGMWAEADGQPAAEGWFELPLREVRRTREEIKANKRPLYARRYALFDQLQEAVAKGLGSR
ncbi:MAG: DUF535 domain-containing protein [Verrucomicrobia bacterium]|nr:DUF535 domain-containing protein [Verrucomicrobiota bacterium]